MTQTASTPLKSLVEKIESLEEEKKELGHLIRDAFAELKTQGFDPKIVRRVLKCRQMKRDDYLEEENLLCAYLNEVGMSHLISGTPGPAQPDYAESDAPKKAAL